MDSVLVISLDTNDLRQAAIIKTRDLIKADGKSVSVGLNIDESGAVLAGIVLSESDLREAAIELAQTTLGQRVLGPVTVDFITKNDGCGPVVTGAKVNFKWGGKA